MTKTVDMLEDELDSLLDKYSDIESLIDRKIDELRKLKEAVDD